MTEVLAGGGLVPTPLKCRACGVNQVWALPGDARLRDVAQGLVCHGCGAVGGLFLSTRQLQRRAYGA